LLQVGDDYVRDVIHALNERGFDASSCLPSSDPTRRAGSTERPHARRHAGQSLTQQDSSG
jgi:hypothetical protein